MCACMEGHKARVCDRETGNGWMKVELKAVGIGLTYPVSNVSIYSSF